MWEIGDGVVELGESSQLSAKFFDAWRAVEVGDAGHPWGEFPQMASVGNERLSGLCRSRYWQETAASLCRMAEYGVDESQPVRRRMLNGPTAEDERTRRCGVGRPAHNSCSPTHNGGNPPELRTTHSAGRAQRFDVRRLDLRQVVGQNILKCGHFNCRPDRRGYHLRDRSRQVDFLQHGEERHANVLQ